MIAVVLGAQQRAPDTGSIMRIVALPLPPPGRVGTRGRRVGDPQNPLVAWLLITVWLVDTSKLPKL